MGASLREILYTARPVEPFAREALFSYLGRYLHSTGSAESVSFQRAVIGRYPTSLSYDMPGHLEWIRINLPPLNRFSLEDMVQRFTAAPLYRPFMDEEGWTALVQKLGKASPRIGADPEFRQKEMHRFPRHCRVCLQSQLRRHRLAFWPREFGLRLVEACPKHGLLLEQVPCYSYLPLRFNRGFAAPSMPQNGTAIQASQAQVRFSKLVIDLLHAGITSVPQAVISDVYAQRCRARGYVYLNRIDRKAFWRDASRFWSGLDMAKCGEDAEKPGWTRSQRTSSPPIHLLNIGFLFGTVAEWKRAVEAAQKVPPKPQPVMHQTVGLVRPVQLQHVRESKIKGIAKVRLDRWECILNEPPLPCGKAMEPELKMLLEQGLPIAEVVLRSGIPRMTVYRRMRSNHAVTRRWIAQALKREYEARYVQCTDGGAGSLQRAKTLQGKRAWLYRHRKALLMAQELGMELAQPAPASMAETAAKPRRSGGKRSPDR